ncbi:MAG TPA: hypothetical protein VNW99_08655 [Cytophagaceae bacterium]|jgi:hypothetical protein|nr:hypothetical protein [Cytophagaceae bacterium]
MFTCFFLKAIKDKNADYNKDNQLSFEEIFSYERITQKEFLTQREKCMALTSFQPCREKELTGSS